MDIETESMLWVGWVSLCLVIFSVLLAANIIMSISEAVTAVTAEAEEVTAEAEEVTETNRRLEQGYMLSAIVWILIAVMRNETLHRELRKNVNSA